MPKLLSGKDASIVFSRNPRIKGPMTVFGYDYFADHYGKEQKMPALLSFNGIYGSGPVYCYEALNLVNGVRSVMEIRNALSAEFGPVPLEDVAEYLWALEKIGVLSQK